MDKIEFGGIDHCSPSIITSRLSKYVSFPFKFRSKGQGKVLVKVVGLALPFESTFASSIQTPSRQSIHPKNDKEKICLYTLCN